MKKKIVFFLSVIFIFMFNIEVQALTGTADVNDYLILRNGPGTSYNEVAQIYPDVEFNILDTSAGSGNGCSNSWYKISFGNNTGYVCGTYVKIKKETISNSEDDSYDRSNYDKPKNSDGTIVCYEDTGSVKIRKSASLSAASTGTLADCGDEVKVLDVVESTTVSSSKSVCPFWYKIQKGNVSGYVCGYYVNTTKLSSTAEKYYSSNSKSDYTASLKGKGFPDSYIPYLLEIHARHPNWIFKAEKINLNYDDVVDNEAINERSLLDERSWSYDKNYLSTASFSYNALKDSFIVTSEEGHYNASKETIAYYLDPRNYLNEKYIFAFETMAYDSTQNASTISSILSTQKFWPTIYQNYYGRSDAISDGSTGNVSSDVVKAASLVGVSATHIATRMNQELGNMSTSDSRIGGSFSYNGNSYSGYYNFFNIKSNCSNCSSIYTGYAYEKGWNTPYKGIYGGAQFLYNGYISVNQDTIYYEKFDVSTTNGHYTHQYMQNIVAPVMEGGKKYDGYYNSTRSYLDKEIVFVIPVYDNMPTNVVTAPKLGNPNNYLNNLAVDGKTVSQFNYSTYNYNVYLNSSVNSVNISASTVNSNATVAGVGKITLDSNTKTQDIIVTSQSGRDRKYTITFIRQASNPITVEEAMNNCGFKYNDKYLFGIEEGTNVSNLVANIISYNNSVEIEIKSAKGEVKTNDSFRTGDKVKITGSDGTREFTVIIYGDVNGDGEINRNDLLYVQSAAFGYVDLDTIKKVAADIDKNGSVDKNDLLYVQSHVFGYSKIKQG